MTTRRRSGTALLVLPAVLPVALVLGVALGAAALSSTGLMPVVGPPEATAATWRALAGDRVVLDGLRLSVGLAAASTALAVSGGLALALLVSTSRAGGRVLRAAAAATVPVPHVVAAAAVGLLLADSGLLARVVGAAPGAFPPLVAGPWWAAVVAELAWKESAFVALVVLAALAAHERELDEAAAVLGAGPWQRLRRVALPLAAPATVAAGGIVFAYVLGSYEVAWLLGRTDPEPLAVLAHRLSTDVDLARRDQALAVGLLTTALAASALGACAVLLRRTALARTARAGRDGWAGRGGWAGR